MILPDPSPASSARVASLECTTRVKVDFMTSDLGDTLVLLKFGAGVRY